MGNKIIDRLKSPLIRNELVKHIQKIDTKAIAKAIHEHLDIQLIEKDIKEVKTELVIKLAELVNELKG